MAWSITPPSGWHYFQDETRIEAETHDDLVKALSAYRTSNHLPLGEPEKDVDKFIRARWPHVAGVGVEQDDDKPKQVYGQPERKRISDRVGSWCANRLSRLGAIHFVDAAVAQRRANICIACPVNRPNWKRETIESCPGCQSNVEALGVLAFKLRQGRSVEREGKLGACFILGHEGQVAVHLEEGALQHAKHYKTELPDFCWLK